MIISPTQKLPRGAERFVVRRLAALKGKGSYGIIRICGVVRDIRRAEECAVLNAVKRSLYILLQCTWGLIQTLAGFVVFLFNIRRRHYFYHGAIVTVWSSLSSVSLGMFLFVSGAEKRIKRGKEKQTDQADGEVVVHEYGHTIQSLILGPLYLLVIGIPSLVWANLPVFVKKRSGGVPYASFWTEKSANRLGERATGESSFGDRF